MSLDKLFIPVVADAINRQKEQKFKDAAENLDVKGVMHAYRTYASLANHLLREISDDVAKALPEEAKAMVEKTYEAGEKILAYVASDADAETLHYMGRMLNFSIPYFFLASANEEGIVSGHNEVARKGFEKIGLFYNGRASDMSGEGKRYLGHDLLGLAVHEQAGLVPLIQAAYQIARMPEKSETLKMPEKPLYRSSSVTLH